MTPISFSPNGPFDDEEREVIVAICRSVEQGQSPQREALLNKVHTVINRLDRVGDVLADHPSLFSPQALGKKRRDMASLLEVLEQAELSNFDMFLPTRALLSRYLVMGEMNLYRLLRFVCAAGLSEEVRASFAQQLEEKLCHCVYTRLAEDLLINIAADHDVEQELRQRSVLALAQLWERAAYRLSDFFPVLEATWTARRRMRATLGTLMGTAEMFRLMQEGCDPQFVDYLGGPDCTEDEAAAFREFLFGIFTEQLCELDEQLRDGCGLVSIEHLDASVRFRDAGGSGDPALAMFDFFRSRHLQAAARRQAKLPGPKRTAEEYVMLHYLRHGVDADSLRLAPRPSIPPPGG